MFLDAEGVLCVREKRWSSVFFDHVSSYKWNEIYRRRAPDYIHIYTAERRDNLNSSSIWLGSNFQLYRYFAWQCSANWLAHLWGTTYPYPFTAMIINCAIQCAIKHQGEYHPLIQIATSTYSIWPNPLSDLISSHNMAYSAVEYSVDI